MVYLVIQQGVYKHGIFGAFSDLDFAKSYAKELADSDNDDYHSYCVQPLEIDKKVGFKKEEFIAHHNANEAEPLASFSKAYSHP